MRRRDRGGDAAPKDTRHPDLIRGDFNRDGSWNPEAEVRSVRWRFVDSLVASRRLHPEMPPREFAMRMSALPLFPEMERMFPSIERWLEPVPFAEPYAWAGVYVATSAESAIQYAGRGADERHWFDGEYREGRDNGPLVHNAAELVAALARRLGYRDPEPNASGLPAAPLVRLATADETWFESRRRKT